LYSSENNIRVMRINRIRLVGHVRCMGRIRNACKILFRNPKERRPLGTPTCRWEGNIRWILRDVIYLLSLG
jgi:hypothetical protein